MSDTTNYLRFSSPDTHVSITLPVGWMKDRNEEDPEYCSDLYVLSSNHQYAPQIVIQIIPIPEAERSANNYQELAEVLLAEQCQQVQSHTLAMISQQLGQISGYPARVDIFDYVDEEWAVPITQYQACIQLEDAVCGLVAMVRTEEQAQYLPVFDQAVQSLVVT